MTICPTRMFVERVAVLADRGHRAVVPRLADDDRGRRGIAHRCRSAFDLDAAQMRMDGEIGHAC